MRAGGVSMWMCGRTGGGRAGPFMMNVYPSSHDLSQALQSRVDRQLDEWKAAIFESSSSSSPSAAAAAGGAAGGAGAKPA
jgi:hypothetical protein